MDVVIIGGGHNGLVAAATLARSGRRVTVLEGREGFGGVADGLLHDTETLSPDVVRELDLTSHGLELQDPAPVFVPAREGGGLLLHRDAGLAAEELGSDAGAYREWRDFLGRVLPFARTQLDRIAPDVRTAAPLWPLMKTGLAFRRLGKKDIHELLRVGPACVDDYLSEWFTSPLLRTALAAPALHGTFMGTRSPTSTATLLLHEAQVAQEVVGGPTALVEALVRACRAGGVELQAGAKVNRIRVEGGRAVGVELDDGSPVDAGIVLSCIGPRRTLLDLVAPEALPVSTAGHIRKVRVRGTLARLNFKLSGPIEYACRPGFAPERSLVGEHPLDLERAFDHVKHRRMPTDPPLDIRQSDGVASVLVRCAPFELEGGWTDERRAELTECVLASLERYAPGIRSLATVTQTLTPSDLAQDYALEGGHEMHGELALDQLGPMRPGLALSRHATSIAGLLCGSAGIHPGGGISGRSGRLAALVAGQD
jgi:phytoene dehydrogenase-like protein